MSEMLVSSLSEDHHGQPCPPTRRHHCPAAAWEGLASCYQNLGRFTAALKAYTRALELQPGRPYSRIQVGRG